MANGFIGSEDVGGVHADAEVDHQDSAIGEEWIEVECETTVLDEGDDDDEKQEGEWYDSDATAFDYEDAATCILDALPELPLRIEPEGAWISDEVSAVGEPW